jgi:O-antigen/teichoic acid export membrane protein
LQCAVSIGFASDPLILASTLGTEAVSEYAIPAKLFELLIVAVAMVVGPLWPAYAEAHARGDRRWIVVTLRRSIQLTGLGLILPCLALVIFGPWLISIWMGGDATYALPLLGWFAVWTYLRGTGTAFAMFMNGVGIVRVQVIVATLFAIVSIVSKILAAREAGVVGLVTASVVSYVVVVAVPYALMTPRFLRLDA